MDAPEPTPDDLAIRHAVEVRYKLVTGPQFKRPSHWSVGVRGCVPDKRGFASDPVSATRDWCQRNGVEWRLPE